MELDEKIKKTLRALEKHDFTVYYVNDPDEARDLILKLSEGCRSVGVGGTATVRATGVLEALRERGLDVFDHWIAENPQDSLAVRKSQLTADLFLTGSNAITMTGELINVDGIGNRVNAMTFGPPKVIVVAGVNKIVPDIAAGIDRIKNVAAPKRAKELNVQVPCVKKGKCTDCNVPQRICRVTVIHNRRPALTDMSIIIIGKEMGL